MSDGQFARLSAASKVLFDRELIELRCEVEALRRDIALKERTLRKMREALATYQNRIIARDFSRDLLSELKSSQTLIAYYKQTLAVEFN